MKLPPIDGDIERLLDEAAGALLDADRVAVATHVQPDGDAVGSMVAATLGLRSLGRTAAAGWAVADGEVPGQYVFLPGLDVIAGPDDVPPAATALAVDCATAERLGGMRERVAEAAVSVNIDHHVSNSRFGTINVVDPEAPSTTELILRLLIRMGAEITKDVATCLYTGLYTDTGQFSYASATPRAHAAAAHLIERGVRVEEVSQAVFESAPYPFLKVLGRTLERCRLLAEPPLVISYLTQADLDELGLDLDDTEEVINILRATRDADVAAVLKEMPDGNWKGSLRSKGSTDVQRVAARFGGGGHTLAAGFTSTLGLEDTITEVHRGLREAGRPG